MYIYFVFQVFKLVIDKPLCKAFVLVHVHQNIYRPLHVTQLSDKIKLPVNM